MTLGRSRGTTGSGGRSLPRVMLGRLRWSVRGLMPVTSPVVMAQAFAYLYGAGATLVLVTLLLPHDPDRFVPGLVAPALIAYVVASLMLIGFERIPLVGLLVPARVGIGADHVARVLGRRGRGGRVQHHLLLGGAVGLLLPRRALRDRDADRHRRRVRRRAGRPHRHARPPAELAGGRRHADRGGRADLAAAAAQRAAGGAARRGPGCRPHRQLGVAHRLRRGGLVGRAVPDPRAARTTASRRATTAC